jgi:hypothetical protein
MNDMPRHHRTIGPMEAAPHFEAAVAVWLFQRASEEYLALPEMERDPIAERIFKALEFNIEQLQDAIGCEEGNPIISREDWEPLWEAWAKQMPLPKEPVRRTRTAEEEAEEEDEQDEDELE